MSDPERIILEPAGDGEHYRIHTEGSDTEGHMPAVKRFEVEPDGQDADGNPLFRVTGEDAEGHALRAWSDLRLKHDVRPL